MNKVPLHHYMWPTHVMLPMASRPIGPEPPAVRSRHVRYTCNCTGNCTGNSNAVVEYFKLHQFFRQYSIQISKLIVKSNKFVGKS